MKPTAAALSILALTFFVAPVPSRGQQPGKIYRIGFLSTAPQESISQLIEALVTGLRDQGYVDGRNVAIVYRSAEGKIDRLPKLAAELVQLGMDTIVATSTPAASAAKEATTRVPIVMVSPADPVREGLITSLARPGGNLTGVTLEVTAETSGKQL